MHRDTAEPAEDTGVVDSGLAALGVAGDQRVLVGAGQGSKLVIRRTPIPSLHTKIIPPPDQLLSRNLCARVSKLWIRAGVERLRVELSRLSVSFFRIRCELGPYHTDTPLMDTLDVMPAMSGVCAWYPN